MKGDKFQLHWMAGFFDAKGSISIAGDRNSTRQSAIRLEGSSQDRDILKRVQDIAGGTIQAKSANGQRPRQSDVFGNESDIFRNADQKTETDTMTENEIGQLAKAIAAALMPMMKQLGEQEPDDEPDGSGDISGASADQIDAVQKRVAKFRRVLRGCTTFADAERRLADRGVASGGRRRTLIAKLRPELYNARMSEAYNGSNP